MKHIIKVWMDVSICNGLRVIDVVVNDAAFIIKIPISINTGKVKTIKKSLIIPVYSLFRLINHNHLYFRILLMIL